LLAQSALQVTAIFAGNNFIAIGVLQALREIGISVPEDISVVVFDDLPETYTREPFLTVAVQPAYELGKTATALLLEQLKEPIRYEAQEIVLPTQLIVRSSTKAVGGGIQAQTAENRRI
jgi:LacI family transcriptional regulator